MNYLLTILFLTLIFILYEEFGALILRITRYEEVSLAKKELAGFIYTFTLSFICGVPCQYKHLSWRLFFILYSIALIASIIVVAKFNYKESIERWKNRFKNWKQTLWTGLSENYLILILIGMFTILSMTGTLAYYQMNYDDAYYIGKIVNLIGSPGLLNENYFNGALFDGFEGGISRLFNTYEITYGYFASIFHISVPFFCRCAMTIHNYIIMFISFKAFASFFLNKKNAQYSVAIFSIFLISYGYMMRGAGMPLHIRIYDGCQIQTAMWYGGSIVRMTAIPMILVFGKEIFEKLDYRKVIFMAMIYMAYLSFSTIFFPYAVFLTFGFALYECLDFAVSDSKYSLLGLVGVAVLMAGLMVSVKLKNMAICQSASYLSNYEQYCTFYEHYIENDIIHFFMPYILPLGFILSDKKAVRYCIGCVFVMFIIFNVRFFDSIIMLTTVNFMFVAMRCLASMQYFTVLLAGIIIVYVLEKCKIHTLVMSVLSIACLAGSVFYIKSHIYEIETYTFTGSGMYELGYDLDQLTRNDEMIPEVYVEVGEYFNSLPYDNYRLIVNEQTPYEGTTVIGYGFVACSNRIEIYCHGGINDMVREEYLQLVDYLNGDKTLDEVQNLIDEHEVQYLLVHRKESLGELEAQGYEVVVASNHTSDYYLVKTTYA